MEIDEDDSLNLRDSNIFEEEGFNIKGEGMNQSNSDKKA